MVSTVAGFVVPFILYFASCFLVKKQNSKRQMKKQLLDDISNDLQKVTIFEVLFFGIVDLIPIFLMCKGKGGVPIVIELIAMIIPFLAVLTKVRASWERVGRFFKRASIAFMAVIAAEVLVFNAKSFDTKHKDIEYDLSKVSSGEFKLEEDGSIVLNEDKTLALTNIPDGVTTLVLDAEREIKEGRDNPPFLVSLDMKDDNFKEQQQVAQRKYTMANGRELTFRFTPYGKCYGLYLIIGDTHDNFPIKIKSIRLLSAAPFHFSYARCLVLAAIAILVIAILTFELWKVTYQHRKRSHVIIVEALILICTFSSILFTRPNEKPFIYNKDVKNTADMYSMTFDAFKHGHVYLDLYAEPGLEDIENVYDRSQRDKSGIFYFWDFAYYEGHYYSYFGATPVVLFYFPYFFIKGKVPTVPMASAFFGIFAVYFICRTLLAFIKIFVPRPNMLLLLTSFPALLACVEVFNSINETSNYYLPITSGLCFLFMSLWLGLGSYTRKNKPLKLVMLFFSGIALGFCVGSRPGMSLCSVLLIPMFLGILRDKKQSIKFRAAQAASFLAPLLACGGVIMWYNNARFGSPFDFGAAYQLTVSDIHANKLSLSNFFPMVYHYFFQFPRPRTTFPFIETQFFGMDNYTKYMFLEPIIPIFTYPMLILGYLFIPISLQRNGKHYYGNVSRLQRRSMIGLCFIASIIIAWWNFCLGGVALRYVIDVLPLIALGSLVCTLRAAGDPKKHTFRYTVIVCSNVVTLIIGLIFPIGSHYGGIMRHCPNLFETLEDLIIFWQ